MSVTATMLLAGVALLSACSDAIAERVDDDHAAATARFGEDERLAVAVGPGRVRRTQETETGFAIELRAGGPYPEIQIDNGTFSEHRIVVTIENVARDARFVPRVSPLPSRRRQDARCTRLDADEIALLAAPATPTFADGELRAVTTLDAPRCSRTVLATLPSEEAASLSVMVVGPIDRQRSYLNAVISAANERRPDFVQFTGSVASGDETDPFGEFADAVAELTIPYGVSLTRSDARTDAATFADQFGPTTFAATLGAFRYLVLDTSAARLSDRHFDEVETVDTRQLPGVVIAEWPVIDRDPSAGFRSAHQSRRVLAMLAARGFQTLISAAGEVSERDTFGPFALWNLGHDAREARRVLHVELRRPWPALDPCGVDRDCADTGICDRGYCRVPCAGDDDCPAARTCAPSGRCRHGCSDGGDCSSPLPECSDGWCAEDPEIVVTTLSL